DITDGTSNTLLAVEAGEAVPWSKPEDIAFVPDQAIPPLGGLFPNGFNAAFCDGSVRFISRNVDPKVLQNLIIGSDGQPINFKNLGERTVLPSGRARSRRSPPPTHRSTTMARPLTSPSVGTKPPHPPGTRPRDTAASPVRPGCAAHQSASRGA